MSDKDELAQVSDKENPDVLTILTIVTETANPESEPLRSGWDGSLTPFGGDVARALDAWLAKRDAVHDREVARRAWNEGALTAADFIADGGLMPVNPYDPPVTLNGENQ